MFIQVKRVQEKDPSALSLAKHRENKDYPPVELVEFGKSKLQTSHGVVSIPAVVFEELEEFRTSLSLTTVGNIEVKNGNSLIKSSYGEFTMSNLIVMGLTIDSSYTEYTLTDVKSAGLLMQVSCGYYKIKRLAATFLVISESYGAFEFDSCTITNSMSTPSVKIVGSYGSSKFTDFRMQNPNDWGLIDIDSSYMGISFDNITQFDARLNF